MDGESRSLPTGGEEGLIHRPMLWRSRHRDDAAIPLGTDQVWAGARPWLHDPIHLQRGLCRLLTEQ